MLKKFFQFIFGLCMAVGFLLSFLTAGASDCELIDTIQITRSLVISAFFLAIGFFGLKLTGWEYID